LKIMPSLRDSLCIIGVMLCLTCGRDRVAEVLPVNVRVDSFLQQGAAAVDVLWVIDNSGSMAPRQETLARNMQAFVSRFTLNKTDYRLAVTTTDAFRERGQFVGTPAIVTPQTPNPAATFSRNVRVGIDGSPFEVGLETALLAVEMQKQSNADIVKKCQSACQPADGACKSACETKSEFPFLRNGAYLYIVFLSDEDDKGQQDTRFYFRAIETAKGLGNDGTVTTAAIVGNAPNNSCGAKLGSRYLALSQLTGGEVGSICDENFAATLRKLATNAVGLRRKFALQEKPNPTTIQVEVSFPCDVEPDALAACAEIKREACSTNSGSAAQLRCIPKAGEIDGWLYNAETNSVVFDGDAVPGVNSKVSVKYFLQGKEP
jgi:hypothetical protein